MEFATGLPDKLKIVQPKFDPNWQNWNKSDLWFWIKRPLPELETALKDEFTELTVISSWLSTSETEELISIEPIKQFLEIDCVKLSWIWPSVKFEANSR
jgi:hypothetical protein